MNTAPLGVISKENGEFRLVYDLAELAVFSFETAPRYPAYCGDSDCADLGCWCVWTEPGETYHCCSCTEPYDRDYQCALAAKVCPHCCGHQTCAARYDQRLSGKMQYE